MVNHDDDDDAQLCAPVADRVPDKIINLPVNQ